MLLALASLRAKLTRQFEMSYLYSHLVLLEVVINGVLQFPKLLFLLDFFLFFVPSKSRFNIIFFLIIILWFLQRQKRAGGRKWSQRGVLEEMAELNTKLQASAVRVSHNTYLPLTPAHPGVTNAICSSMTTVATWLDFTSSWVTPFAVFFSH